MKLAVVLLPLLGGLARADNAAPVRALLADPAQLASWLRDRDPKVESARAKLEAAQASGEQARVLPNPQLSAGRRRLPDRHDARQSRWPATSLPLSQTLNVSVGVSELFELGKRAPRRHAADLRTREAGEQAIGSLGDRLGDATTALGKLTYVVAKRAVIAVNLSAARRLRDNEKIRLDNKDSRRSSSSVSSWTPTSCQLSSAAPKPRSRARQRSARIRSA